MNTINLDLITGAKNIINLMQFDVKGEKINIVLTENDADYNLGGKTIRLQGIKADGKAILLPTAIKNDNTIEFDIAEQLTVVKGIIQLQLLIFGEGGSLKNSKIFGICIDESLKIGEIIASDNDFKEIKDTLIKVDELSVNLTNIENYKKINRLSSKIISLQTIDFKNDFIKGGFINAVADVDWVVGDNSIIPKCNQTSQKGTLALYKKYLIQDGEIGATIKGYDLATTRDFWTGLIIKGLDLNNNLLIAINPFDKTVNIFKNTNGVLTSLKKVAIDNPQSLLTASTNLVVKFYGVLFSVFVNGTCYIKDVSSSSLRDYKSNGFFGVGSYSSSVGGFPFIQNIEFKDVWMKEYKYDSIPTKINKILYTGDSNCIGQGVDVKERWSNLLDDEIMKTTKEYNSKNVASGGKVTLEIFENQIKTNINNTYDICTILGGTNNSRVDEVGTTIESALNDIRYSVRYIKAFGVTPIICLPSIIDKTVNTMAYKEGSYNWLSEYRNGLVRIATIEKIPFVDFSNGLNNNLSLLQADKIHLNQEGHIRVFNEFVNVLYGINSYLK